MSTHPSQSESASDVVGGHPAPKKTKARKPKALVRYYDAAPQTPPLAEAAGLLVTLLKRAKMGDLKEYVDAALTADHLPGLVALTTRQIDLLGQHSAVLSKVTPGVTVSVCQQCQEFVFVGSGVTAPTKCALTARCTGRMVKAKAARRITATSIAP